MERLYSRTAAGQKAWDAQDGRVPLEVRRVLGLVDKETDPKDICAKLGCSASALNEILKELEQGKMVKSIGAGTGASELDFTGSFSVADIQAGREKIRHELDFTGKLKAEDLRAAREKK
ncbi:MAG: hypothetical protein ACREVQ_08490 [Burkholderiales bacterium]